MDSGDISLLVTMITFAAVVGVFIGSFLNVVVYRAPLGLSVSTPRSFCPNCKHQLSWWENIPVASWVALKGRCRTCHQPISIRYPLVEALTGVTFALTTWAWHGKALSAGYCVLAAAMIVVSLIECGGKRSPLAVAAIGTASGQLLIVLGAVWQQRWSPLAGSFVGTFLGIIIYGALRSTDPECNDPRSHGRSALLIAGCWLGGLGPRPAAFGVALWIVTYFGCMVIFWSTSRRQISSGAGRNVEPRPVPIFGVPLVTALVVAMAASLVIGG